MPTFIQKNPKELQGDYKINNKISSRLMSANAVSGFIGTSKKDTENYDNLIKLLEDSETQQELFLDKLSFMMNGDNLENARLPTITHLYISLKKIFNLISKKTFSLYYLPETDVNKIRDYIGAMESFLQQYNDAYETLYTYLTGGANQRGRPRKSSSSTSSSIPSDFSVGRTSTNDDESTSTGDDVSTLSQRESIDGRKSQTYDDLRKLIDILTRIIDILKNKILTYTTAFIEPPEKLVMSHEELVGGCGCEYKGNPMYQTRKYLMV